MNIKRWFKRRRASEIPEILPYDRKIDPETRRRLRDWLDNPDTKLALSIVASGRPSAFAAGGGAIGADVEAYRERTIAWFNMQRGWDAFYRALQGLRYEKPVYVEPRETFPENEDII
jgi:hypothetical protein